MTFIPTTDFLIEVAKGNVTGHALVNKFGRNPDVDTGTDPEDIWDGGGIWVPPTTARTHQITSSDDEDGGAGTDTGALTLRLFGLDASFALQQEDITLDGTNDVATASTYTMIHRMDVLTAGSAGKNIGVITATADTDASVTAQIAPANNQTEMAIYQIPAATTGYLLYWYCDAGKAVGAAGKADIELLVKDFGAVYRLQRFIGIDTSGEGAYQEPMVAPIQVAAKTIIKLHVETVSASDMDIIGGFDLLLVDD